MMEDMNADDDAPLMEPSMSNKKKSLKSLKEDENSSEKDSRLSKFDEGSDCCYCIAPRTGVLTINVIAVFLVMAAFLWTCIMLWNDQFSGWYCLINFLLVVGLGVVGIIFIFQYSCSEENRAVAKRMAVGHLLILIMWATLSVWNIVYI